MGESISQEPKFSIIIPTYNRADKLKMCIESVMGQTEQNFELLICDDGSKDKTKEMLESYIDDKKVRYFYNDNWGGPAYPRNVGIRNARASWICFLDSDDTWEPQKLEQVARYTEHYDFICHYFNVIGVRKLLKTIRTSDLTTNPLERLLTKGNSIVTSSVCVKKSILEEMNGFSLDRDMIAVEDFDLWLRIAEKGYRFKVIPQCLGNYYTGEGNITEASLKQINRINTVFGLHQRKLNSAGSMYKRSKGFTAYICGRVYHEMRDYGTAVKRYQKAILMATPSIRIKALLHLLKAKIKR